jgi:succinate dehydrogenase / fumarate reductase flavoprotein subunit
MPCDRNESCGGHFREEYQTADGEAQRDDEHYSYVAAWGYTGPDAARTEQGTAHFEYVHPSQRSYK